MPKSNKQLKLNAEMEKQIKRNDEAIEKLKKEIADRLEKN